MGTYLNFLNYHFLSFFNYFYQDWLMIIFIYLFQISSHNHDHCEHNTLNIHLWSCDACMYTKFYFSQYFRFLSIYNWLYYEYFYADVKVLLSRLKLLLIKVIKSLFQFNYNQIKEQQSNGKLINIVLVEFPINGSKCCTYVNKLKKRRKYMWIQMNSCLGKVQLN